MVLMGINLGAVEAKVLQNHSTGACSLGKCVPVTSGKLCAFVHLKKEMY